MLMWYDANANAYIVPSSKTKSNPVPKLWKGWRIMGIEMIWCRVVPSSSLSPSEQLFSKQHDILLEKLVKSLVAVMMGTVTCQQRCCARSMYKSNPTRVWYKYNNGMAKVIVPSTEKITALFPLSSNFNRHAMYAMHYTWREPFNDFNQS